MGILNHPVDGERWRTVKHVLKYRRGELFVVAGACVVYAYFINTELNRYCSYLNKSAMFGGRCGELEKPELVGCSDVKLIQFKSDLDKIVRDGTN